MGFFSLKKKCRLILGQIKAPSDHRKQAYSNGIVFKNGNRDTE
jgi:hypothetical protein